VLLRLAAILLWFVSGFHHSDRPHLLLPLDTDSRLLVLDILVDFTWMKFLPI
jgi:hypothetical protein